MLPLDRPGPATQTDYVLSRWLFLRLVGLVYLVAITSLWVQVDGLVGSRGILPAADCLQSAKQQLGSECYWRLPTLCWLGASDAVLHGLCALGDIVALLLMIGMAPIPALVLLWMIYLSLSVVGQTFLSFQWDTLLLETGFFAIFLAPGTMLPGIGVRLKPVRRASEPVDFGTIAWIRRARRPIVPFKFPVFSQSLAREISPNPVARWLLWWLLFKLMFLSGITKLLSGDATWRALTAMDVHYQTQPIPNWVSWYAHQLPGWWQKMTVGGTFAAELIVPFLIFAPRAFRHVACLLLVLLQVGIGVTGNYGFFNLLTIVLCVPLLDDRLLVRFVPRRWAATLPPPQPRPSLGTWKRIAVYGPLLILLTLSFMTFLRELVRTQDRDKLPSAVVTLLDGCDRYILSWGEPYVLEWINPFRTINGYGLFRVMTTERPEIVIEASPDGIHWTEWEFRWKPGDVRRSPRFVAPHQPRLDWQMWFAALNPPSARYWLGSLVQRLLEGSPEVAGLLEASPFPEGTPRYVRLIYYRYEFTDKKTRRQTGQWWQRTRSGALTGSISLQQLRRPAP
jgi:hypothetical protein